jgi:hypothetical protein
VTQRFDDIPAAEQRLLRLRQVAASVPARQAVVDQAKAEVATREKGLMVSATAAQEEAQLLQMVRGIARAQTIEVAQSEIGQVEKLGSNYGEARVTVSFTCRIEQLVNLMADLTARGELVATREMQLRQADAKLKTIFVRLTVSAATPGNMVAGAKGNSAL